MNVTGESACVLGTPTYGMPYGGGAMSGCSSRVPPIHEMNDADFASTGAWLISRFHQLLVRKHLLRGKVFQQGDVVLAAPDGLIRPPGDSALPATLGVTRHGSSEQRSEQADGQGRQRGHK